MAGEGVRTFGCILSLRVQFRFTIEVCMLLEQFIFVCYQVEYVIEQLGSFFSFVTLMCVSDVAFLMFCRNELN